MAGAQPDEAAWPVAIVGAGPVGLALALGLGRHGVRSVLLERDAGTSVRSKAPGIHQRTLEALRPWGADEVLRDAGTWHPVLRLHAADADDQPLLTFDVDRLDDEADRPGVLILEQGETERLLLERVRADGACDVRFGTEVLGVDPGASATTLRVRVGDEEHRLAARYVVACDGASSTVRDAVDLPFEGRTYQLQPLLADIDLEDGRDELPWPRAAFGDGSITTALRLRPGRWRLIHLDPADDDGVVDQRVVAGWVDEVLGAGPVEVVWCSRFRIHRRATPRFRKGPVVLAGDAAHVHSPVGGQGMNAGIQDTENLAWKLAAALDGGDEDRLLDSYDTERRAVVVEDVSRSTDVVTRLFLQSPAVLRRALFTPLRWGLRIPALHRRAVRRLAMVDLALPPSALLDEGDRAAGVRLPNPLLRRPTGGFVRLHDEVGLGPALLEVADRRDPDLGVDVPVVHIGPGGFEDPTGRIRGLLGGADGWILARPDHHVAWARTDRAGLPGAVASALGRRHPGDTP